MIAVLKTETHKFEVACWIFNELGVEASKSSDEMREAGGVEIEGEARWDHVVWLQNVGGTAPGTPIVGLLEKSRVMRVRPCA